MDVHFYTVAKNRQNQKQAAAAFTWVGGVGGKNAELCFIRKGHK